MLEINKKQSHRRIRGKRIRKPIFNKIFYIIAAMLVITFALCYFFMPKGDDWYTIMACVCIGIILIPFSIMMDARKPILILGDDRLYFWGGYISKKLPNLQKSEITAMTNGSVAYSDIHKLEFRPSEVTAGVRGMIKLPSQIKLICADFEVKIDAGEFVIAEIDKKRNEALYSGSANMHFGTDPIGIKLTSEHPQIWRDIASAFEDGRIENLWEQDTDIDYCEYDFETDEIDILLYNKHNEDMRFKFFIDCDEICALYLPDDVSECKELSEFADADEVLDYMKDYERKVLYGNGMI